MGYDLTLSTSVLYVSLRTHRWDFLQPRTPIRHDHKSSTSEQSGERFSSKFFLQLSRYAREQFLRPGTAVGKAQTAENKINKIRLHNCKQISEIHTKKILQTSH